MFNIHCFGGCWGISFEWSLVVGADVAYICRYGIRPAPADITYTKLNKLNKLNNNRDALSLKGYAKHPFEDVGIMLQALQMLVDTRRRPTRTPRVYIICVRLLLHGRHARIFDAAETSLRAWHRAHH
jgi:hypothetical protein